MALTLEDRKSIFIEALKKTYKVQYDAVQPIPYIKDKLYCVDKIFVEGGIEASQDESWIRLKSYKDIFVGHGTGTIIKRCILVGEPGYGKSTLTLQLAYDWSNGVSQSPLGVVEILILLRLRQLCGISSISKAIKMFLLSKEPRIKMKDIEEILESCSSITITLDGYDEYPEKDSDRENEINNIIMMEMFPNVDVTLTTRYLPKHYDVTTKRVRLTGFDSRARDEYIRKAVVGNDDEAVEKIKRKLQENSILADLCQVPLIFVMFAHMAHDQKKFQTFNTVTSFFRYMITCFHEHMRLKSKDKNVKELYQYENTHDKLDKIAFEGLINENQQLTWKKEDVVERLGQDFYDQYVNIGILVEEQVLKDGAIGEVCEFITVVRFYHKLFCEWYAGFYLASYAARPEVAFLPWNEYDSDSDYSDDDADYEVDLLQGLVSDESETEYAQEEVMPEEYSDILNKLDPFDLQYLFRFACGLRLNAGKKIIEYLHTREDADKFTVLCILEQSGNIDDVKESVRKICSRDVEIKKDDTALLQRSTTQLLDMASRNDIPIHCLTLNQAFENVEEDVIILSSGLTLPKLLTVEKIHIETNEKNPKELTEDDVMKLFIYALESRSLTEISFGRCLLPHSVSVMPIVNEMITRNIKVCWHPSDHEFRLNIQTGQWRVRNNGCVRKLCSDIVYLHGNKIQSKLKQRSTIQQLTIASNYEIPIQCVYLIDCSPRGYEFGKELYMSSGLSLCILSTVQQIWIDDSDGILTKEEFSAILGYSSKCTGLLELVFGSTNSRYVLPKPVPVASIPASLVARNVKVFDGYRGLRLNLRTGRWEKQ